MGESESVLRDLLKQPLADGNQEEGGQKGKPYGRTPSPKELLCNFYFLKLKLGCNSCQTPT